LGVPLHAQTVLKQLIEEEFPSMSAFAKQCGVSQSLVWRDCQGRQISDRRFTAYIGVFSPEGRERLLRARLRDILPEELERMVEVDSAPRLKDDLSNLSLLSQESRAALNTLAGEMASDDELHRWVMTFVKKIC
jgi:hypothetical protein